MIYGGGKNYLGHDKHWSDNLILFPDRWAGDPCVQIWGGPEHYFVGNECVVGDGQGDTENMDSGQRQGVEGRRGEECTASGPAV